MSVTPTERAREPEELSFFFGVIPMIAPASVARLSDRAVAVPYAVYTVSEDFEPGSKNLKEAQFINEKLKEIVDRINDMLLAHVRVEINSALKTANRTFEDRVRALGGTINSADLAMFRGSTYKVDMESINSPPPRLHS